MPGRLQSMASGVLKIMVLAGRPHGDGPHGPVPEWLDRLERRGCRLQVVCLSKGAVLADDPRAWEFPALGSRWLRGFTARAVRADVRIERPDLIHVVHTEMGEAAMAVAEAAALPYVQSVTDFPNLECGLRLSRRWCRHLVATGTDLAQALIEELGVPGERIEVIPPGIVCVPAESGSTRSWGVPVIGTGGPLEDGSGLMVFLEAARRILDAGYDTEFLIAGQGSLLLELRRRAHQWEISERVTVTEFPSVGTEFWSVQEIYCQPATESSSGRTLLEAMAHAIPSIGTAVPGLRELIESGTSGLLIPPGHPEALEQAIRRLLDHPEEARRLGQNARAQVSTRFDPDAEADRLVALYRRIVAGEPGNPDASHR